MKKEKLAFSFGILNLIISILYLNDREIGFFIVFLILTIVCFVNCRRMLFKIISKPIVKRISKLKKEERRKIEELKLLERKKLNIETFLDNNDKNIEIYNKNIEIIDRTEKEKKRVQNTLELLRKETEKLEHRKVSLKEIKENERIVARALKSEEKNFEILLEQNENLTKTKEELEQQVSNLLKRFYPLKEKEKFAEICNINNVDKLSGIDFEKFVAKLLECLDYDYVITTKESGDYGLDIIAVKDNIKYGFQCKNYKETVGNKAIQEAYSGKSYYSCHVAIVITNNYFTPNAIRQAEKNNVVLWDRKKLEELIKKFAKM